MTIAVIVVNWNSGDLLRECLVALERQRRKADRILVLDNASSDDSLARAAAACPRAEVVRLERNLGFAAANNAGLRLASDCDWVALLNPDAFAEPDWLDVLAQAAETHEGYASFASQLRAADAEGLLDGTGDLYHVSGAAWRAGHGEPVADEHHQPCDVFSACAAAALYRRDALLEVGGFDESYFCYMEDVDLGFRLRLAGYRCLYVPRAVVRHVAWGTTERRGRFSVYHGHRNLVWTYWKDMPGVLLLLYLPQHVLLNLATVAWFALHGDGGVILKAKWDAVRGLGRVWRDRRCTQSRRRVGAWALRRALTTGWLTPYRARMLR